MVLKIKKIKDQLRDLTSTAFENDIFGAPTFVVNNKIFGDKTDLIML